MDCQATKLVLKEDAKSLASKQIFARWQAILSILSLIIEFIRGESNSLPDFSTREFLQGNKANNGSHD